MNENKYFLECSIAETDVSLVNSLRRICLANIPNYVIKEDDIDITKNTSRFNNEIIKQRIQCIPVHILDNSDEEVGSEYLEISQDDYKAIHPDKLEIGVNEIVLRINKTNKSQTTAFVTTEDIGLYRSIDDETEIQYNNSNGGKDQMVTLSSIVFPPDPITKNHIVIARLKPPVDTTLPGESLTLTAKFSLGTAKEQGGFNVVSTCAYENKVNEEKSNYQWIEKKKELTSNGNDEAQIKLEEENWKLLDGRRQQYRDNNGEVHDLCVENAFNFKIETVGVYTNIVILQKACIIMKKKCNNIITSIGNNSNSSHVRVAHNQNTSQPYEYRVTLHDEDYTIGNPIVNYIYTSLYGTTFNFEINTTDIEGNDEDEGINESQLKKYTYGMELTFVGFKVPHPHIPDGIIRIIYERKEEEDAEPISDRHKDILIRKLKDTTTTIMKAAANSIYEDFDVLHKRFRNNSVC